SRVSAAPTCGKCSSLEPSTVPPEHSFARPNNGCRWHRCRLLEPHHGNVVSRVVRTCAEYGRKQPTAPQGMHVRVSHLDATLCCHIRFRQYSLPGEHLNRIQKPNG